MGPIGPMMTKAWARIQREMLREDDRGDPTTHVRAGRSPRDPDPNNTHTTVANPPMPRQSYGRPELLARLQDAIEAMGGDPHFQDEALRIVMQLRRLEKVG